MRGYREKSERGSRTDGPEAFMGQGKRGKSSVVKTWPRIPQAQYCRYFKPLVRDAYDNETYQMLLCVKAVSGW